jgi:hypothetical protein
MSTLLEQSRETVDYTWTVNEDGTRNYAFKTAYVKILNADETTTCYTIIRSNKLSTYSHHQIWIKKLWKNSDYSYYNRTMFYDNDEDFAKAINAIQKKTDKASNHN